MAAYIVRRKLSGQAGMGGVSAVPQPGRPASDSGAVLQVTVYTEAGRAAAAQEGADLLGLLPSQVEVVESPEDKSFLMAQSRPGTEFDPKDFEVANPSIEDPTFTSDY